MEKQVKIIFEDTDILVCHKYAGIPVQSQKPGQMDLLSMLKNYRMQQKEVPEIYMVHRLDQPVEGLMVFAKTKSAAAALTSQIQLRGVEKEYYALVEGIPVPSKGTLIDYLLRDGRNNTSKVVVKETKGSKKAVLHYEVLSSTNGQRIKKEVPVSLVKILLETGRHHQIRVQMAHKGHPLVGDKKYNPNCGKEYVPISLCSVGISFTHPVTEKSMAYRIEPEWKF